MSSGESSPGDPDVVLPVGLYVVGTPIGNLNDISARALDTLRRVAVILAEDTRHTRKLLTRYDIHTPLTSCHAFNEAGRVEQVLARIAHGEAIALVSDAGMPGVADPGSRVVAACRSAKTPLFVVPGPSAVTSAIALSGFGGGGFVFGGFLPVKSGARRKRLTNLLQLDEPVALYESPHRAMKLLEELEELVPDRLVYVGRELTKHFEQSICETPAALRAAFASRSMKGEWVVVIDRPAK